MIDKEELDRVVFETVQNIRERRQAKMMGQETLSRRCGLGDRTVGIIERGRAVNLTTLYKIAWELNCDPHDLLPRINR